MPSRVAVIGAGAAGLVAARELRREGHEPVVFERAAGVGGTWLYDPATADDPLGAGGVHSSLYASLRTNLPREIMGFLDFPFVADEGAGDPRRYPGHAEVLRYLEKFARRFDLLGLVRLGTEVVRVRRDASAGSWRVSYCSRMLAGAGDGSEELGEKEESFDAVVVCNGHFTQPRLAADIAGIDVWPGKQLHSHNYRVPDQFQGQVVVIIGYHPSGIDISRDIAGVAKEVHVAIRSAPSEVLSSTAHANLWLHSTIERAEEDGTVVFEDGSRVKADAIVHCTGYNYSFPFLGDGDDGDGISVDDNRVGPLYKHVFPPQLAPHISFIGLNSGSALFPLFQLQSNWVAGVLSGRIELPSQEEMTQDVATFYLELESRGCPKRYTHDLGVFTFEYEDWLAKQCGLEKFEEWRKLIFAGARLKVTNQPESYRDEWDDDHFLEQAHHDFTKHL